MDRGAWQAIVQRVAGEWNMTEQRHKKMLSCLSFQCTGLARKFVWVSHIVSIQKNPNELFDPSNMYTFQCPKTLLLEFIGEHDQIGEPCSNVSSGQSYFVICCKPIPCVCVEHSLPLSVFI